MTQDAQAVQPEKGPSDGTPSDGPFRLQLTTKTISTRKAWILTGLSALLIICVFLPWLEQSDNFSAHSFNGLDKHFAVLVPPVIALVMAVLVAIRLVPLWGVFNVAFAGAIQAIIAWSAHEPPNVERGIPGYQVSVGPGMWVSLIVGITVLVWALYAYATDKVPAESGEG